MYARHGERDAPAIATATPRDAGTSDAAVPHARATMPTTDSVDAVALAADGKTLFFIASERLWVRRDGQRQELVRTVSRARNVMCCVHGKVLSLGDDGDVLIDPTSLGVEAFDRGPAIHVSPDGRRGIAGDFHELALVDVPSGANRKVLTRPGDLVVGASWAPDGAHASFLRVDEHGATIVVIDPSTGVSRDLATVRRTASGVAEGLVWANATTLLVADLRDRDSVLVAIDITTGARTDRMRWKSRFVDVRAAGAGTIAYTESRTTNDVLLGELPLAKLAPVEHAYTIGGWLDDGRMVLGEIRPDANTLDVVIRAVEGAATMILPGNHSTPVLLGVGRNRVLFREAQRLWSLDLAGTDKRDLGPLGMFDSVACGGSRCVVLEHAGDELLLRDLDASGARGKPFARIHAELTAIEGSVSPDGQRVAVGEGTAIAIVDRRTGAITRRKLADVGAVIAVELTSDPAEWVVQINNM